MWLDAPGANATLAQPFTLSGWAIDDGSGADSGIDAVHVWATPNPGSNQAPIFVGVANYGRSRSDIAAAFGSQFLASGFDLNVNALAAGTYTLTVYAHSRISGTFNNVRTVTVNVTVQQPRMSIDAPASGATTASTFTVAGWAIDPNATSGSGVDAVHVWVSPNPGSGAAPRFLGVAALGGARPDVAAAFGPSGARSAYALTASLPAGVYDLTVFAHSSVSGTFNDAQTIRITVR